MRRAVWLLDGNIIHVQHEGIVTRDAERSRDFYIRVLGLEAVADRWRDAGTADFLTGVREGHEKMAWMLRALLERSRVPR